MLVKATKDNFLVTVTEKQHTDMWKHTDARHQILQPWLEWWCDAN